MTSLHIQCPPALNPHEWPSKPSAVIRQTSFHKTPEGTRMVSNRILDLATLQRYMEDCAFVGFDVEGGSSSTVPDPTRLGFVYLPELPTTSIQPGMLHGRLGFLRDKIRSDLWSLNVKPRGTSGHLLHCSLMVGWIPRIWPGVPEHARMRIRAGNFPSLWKMALGLGIKELTMGLTHNAGAAP
ncbi:hypothetical protein PG993_003068 [Apiospora rasikravindrae]|uniref:Uncharacterized protein n=1 Tax=Apiospora rasikravindrae TaxID=990691 RepID=A0ABR1TYM7_9PEZI